MDINTRLLRYFAVVAEEGNLTRAARRLFIAQPSLTKQIQHLENQLGLTLFTRSRSGMALTEAGAALAQHAETVLGSWDLALAAAHTADRHGVRTLRLGFVPMAANELTRRILTDFTGRIPDWRIVLRQFEWSDPTAGLATGDSDVALLRLPAPGLDGFDTEVLFSEPRVIALPCTHHLAERERLDFGELLDEPFVAIPVEAGAWRDYWLGVDERGGHPVRIGAIAHNPEECLSAIASGQGLAIMQAAAERFYQRPGVVYRPVDGLGPSEVGVAYPTRRRGEPAIRAFVESCRGATATT
ncbi:LysR family transcriptional regulator [Nocardia sp. NPDC050406]|uniref:LysR family transcriptional regulator n=1 Tax=Nocardia sp. NPDC050406 TaxID=3364318 RepID=UPI0037A3CA8C